MAAKAKLAPVASILNMKGGVGKTTISAHVFRELYLQSKKSTLLVDLDPQFNLTQTLLSETDYEARKSDKKTVLSVMEDSAGYSLYATSSASSSPPKTSDVVVGMKVVKDLKGNIVNKLDLLPGDFSLVKYSLIDDKSVLNKAKARFHQFIEASRKEYDLICLDCNPSSSFLTICALAASTHVVVPVRPDRYSMLGLRLLSEFVDSLPGLAKKPKKIVVLNGVATRGYDPTVENELRSDPVFGPITLPTHLTLTKLLEARPQYTGFATDRRVAHSAALKKRIRQLSLELAPVLGLT